MVDYFDIENKLIEIRNRLPLISPKMPKKELHYLAIIKSGMFFGDNAYWKPGN